MDTVQLTLTLREQPAEALASAIRLGLRHRFAPDDDEGIIAGLADALDAACEAMRTSREDVQ
jgi:hypothetical protein